jgi:hypothetical protein
LEFTQVHDAQGATIQITRQPVSVSVKDGETAQFSVDTDSTPEKFQWQKNGEDISRADESTYSFTATLTNNGEKYRVRITWPGGTEATSDEGTLTVSPGAEKPSPPETTVWAPWTALLTGLILIGVTAGALWPIWKITSSLPTSANGQVPAFPGFIAGELVIAGVFLAMAGVFLAILEFRGRARLAKELRQAPGGGGAEAPPADVLEQVPKILDAFGKLRGAATVFVVAAVLFICATFISWRALPVPAPTPTPTVSTRGTSVAPSATP